MGESIATEVVSASLAGIFSASALYPLEVLKTKMQAESKATKTSTTTTNVTTSECEDSASAESSSDTSLEVIEATSANANANSSAQEKHEEKKTESKKSKSMVKYASDMYAEEGIAPFYAGIETSAFQSAAEKALYFFSYTAFKNAYQSISGNQKMGTSVNLLLGCMAEWAHLPFTLPLDCWTTQIQTGDNGNKGPLAILCTMLGEGDGLRGMYKGIQAYTVLCLKPSIQYTVFEQVKEVMLARKRLLRGASSSSRQREETLTATEAFLLGMVARTVATVAVFPYLRAKVMLQSQKNNDSSANNGEKISIPSMILKMYADGGLSECFQGIGPELTRGVFSAALMLMCKEKIAFAVKKAMADA